MIRFLRITVRVLLAALFLVAGTVHLRQPGLFLQVMPPAIPFPKACILISGVCELLGGVGLLIPLRAIQLLTGWGLTLLLIAVFPANIYMAVDNVRVNGHVIPAWLLWLRLPFQPLLMAGVVWVTGLWPTNCLKKGSNHADQ
jgi:uncharacterized membrane protein